MLSPRSLSQPSLRIGRVISDPGILVSVGMLRLRNESLCDLVLRYLENPHFWQHRPEVGHPVHFALMGHGPMHNSASASSDQLFSAHILVREDVRGLALVSFPVGSDLAEGDAVSTLKQ